MAVKPRWQRRKNARPEEILTAALEAFGDHGFARTTLDDVARRAGVTKGTIYLYYDSKEALLEAVVRETIVPNIARAEQMVAEFRGSSAELIRQMLKGWWDVIGRSALSAVPKLIIAEAANFPELTRFYHREVIQRGQRLFAQVVQRGIDTGEFRPVPVAMTVRLALAPVLLSVVQKHSLYKCVPDDMDMDTLLDTHIDILLRGLAHAPAPVPAHA